MTEFLVQNRSATQKPKRRRPSNKSAQTTLNRKISASHASDTNFTFTVPVRESQSTRGAIYIDGSIVRRRRDIFLRGIGKVGDISQQIEALQLQPGKDIPSEQLPAVIDALTAMMADVFKSKESAKIFLTTAVSPLSHVTWVEAIKSGEIANFLMSLNELKYGSRG